MKIIAHRGSNLKAPENTVSAVKQAWLDGADGVEMDIRLTSDKKVVAIHDENTKRTTGEDYTVRNCTFNFLRRLSCKYHDDNDKIPSLEEIIGATERGKELFLEIKCGKEILNPLKKVLQNLFHFQTTRLNIISFLPEVLIDIWNSFPKINTFKLIDLNLNPNLSYIEAVNDAVKNRITGLGISGEFYKCRQMVMLAESAGLETNVWTVDDTEVAYKYRELGLNYITTNNPHTIKDYITINT